MSTLQEQSKTFSPSLLEDDLLRNDARRDSRNHPVYSDFSHIVGQISGVAATKFAVSLREDDSSIMLNRILPMTKILPSQSKSTGKATPEVLCAKPDCVKSRDKLAQLKAANEPLRLKLMEYSNKIAEFKYKKSAKEKETKQLKIEYEGLTKSIIEKKIIYEVLEQETQVDRDRNNKLTSKMSNLTKVVSDLRKQLENLEYDLELTLQQSKSVKIGFPKENELAYNNPKKIETLKSYQTYSYRKKYSQHEQDKDEVHNLDANDHTAYGEEGYDSD